jgi:hypothetical protein
MLAISLEWLAAGALVASAYEWRGLPLALLAAFAGLFYLAQVHDAHRTRADGRQYAVTDPSGATQGYVRLSPVRPPKPKREKQPGLVRRTVLAIEALAAAARAKK